LQNNIIFADTSKHYSPKPKTVAYENNDRKMESVYSKRIKAGKRRTYFFDVRATRGNDYYLTITESRKRFNDDGYDRHKLFLYKEDFNKFAKALNEAVDYVKTELMPDFDFDSYNHEYTETAPVLDGTVVETMTTIETIDDVAGSETASDEVDKW
jgi:hypothetical protein